MGQGLSRSKLCLMRTLLLQLIQANTLDKVVSAEGEVNFLT